MRENQNQRGGQDLDMDEDEDDYNDYDRTRNLRGVRDNIRDIHDSRPRDYGSRGPGDPRELHFPPGHPYSTVPGSAPVYAASTHHPAAVPGAGYPPSGYDMDPPIQQGSSYAPSYPTGPRPEGGYAYGGPEYPSSVDPYGPRQPASYPTPGPREPIRQEPREPRGGYSMNPRNEPREHRGPRGGETPRYAYVSTPGAGDVSMGGMDDYGSYTTGSTMQPSRGPYSSSSRAAPSAYDPNPADIREPYRPSQPREERRARR